MSAYCVGCGASSKLQCPECKAPFCGKPCFKANWKSHKLTHRKAVESNVTDKMTDVPPSSVNEPTISPNSCADIMRAFQADFHLLTVEKYARTLFASRAFEIGSVVLNEAPLIVFSDIGDLLRRYMCMDAQTKTKLFDLQHYKSSDRASNPSFQGTLDETWTAVSESVADFNASYRANDQPNGRANASSPQSIDVEEMYNISTVCIVNSHGFVKTSSATDATTATGDNDIAVISDPDQPSIGSSSDGFSALFTLGSKVTHSCAPNCAYSSLFIKNSLTYFSVQPIAAGDMLTFSYVDYMCTRDRRQKLLLSKDFFCSCVKCCGPDYAYGVKCDAGGCNGVKLGTCMEQDLDTEWRCLECGNTDHCNSVDEDVDSMAERFEAIKMMYTINGHRFYSQMYIDMMEELITECVTLFCRTHYLVTTILLEIAKLLICGADFLSVHSTVPVSDLRRIRALAATAGLRAVKTIECVEAACVLGEVCTVDHAATHHCTGYVLEACNQLLSDVSATTTTTGAAISDKTILTSSSLPIPISKYVQLLESTYHPRHCDVSRIRLALAQ